ncbi:MAG: hypothetical protein AAGG48_32050 [Planctomycetota bacterium]
MVPPIIHEKAALRAAGGGFLVVTTHLEWRTETCPGDVISEGDIRRRHLLPFIMNNGEVVPQLSHPPRMNEQYFQLANWCAKSCARGCIRLNGIFELFSNRDAGILLPPETWPRRGEDDDFPYDNRQDEVGRPLPTFPFKGKGIRNPISRQSVQFQFCFDLCDYVINDGPIRCEMSDPGLPPGPDRDPDHQSEPTDLGQRYLSKDEAIC